MALILNIDTSTAVCSVALSDGDRTLAHAEIFENFSHASHLTVLIQKLFHRQGIKLSAIDAVAVSCGPGSYTGLRIGVSTAKGLCYSLDKPLIAIGSLDILAWPITKEYPSKKGEDNWYCPMIDARRMEVYTAFFDGEMVQKNDVSAQIITDASFVEVLDQRKVFFFGDGALKCQQVILHPNAVFIEGQVPLAKNMAVLAHKSFQESRFVDVAYFEPFYLKDFVATQAKNKTF